MASKKLTVVEMRRQIKEGEAKDPLAFLDAIMNGQDPRESSEILQLVQDITEFNDGDIPREEWQELLIMLNYGGIFKQVNLDSSFAAAKTLAEYLYPKRKQIDTGDSSTALASDNPLTESEIDIFKARFNEEY